MTPFPGLDEETRRLMAARTQDWSGKGVDPDRDLWQARRTWPGAVIKDNWLCVKTPLISITTRNGRYDLGAFDVALALIPDAPVVRVEQGEKTLCHPHVSMGNLCTGRGRYALENHYRRGLYGECLDVVLQILRTYNPRSPYYGLYQHWAPSKNCPSCGGAGVKRLGLWCESCLADQPGTVPCVRCHKPELPGKLALTDDGGFCRRCRPNWTRLCSRCRAPQSRARLVLGITHSGDTVPFCSEKCKEAWGYV